MSPTANLEILAILEERRALVEEALKKYFPQGKGLESRVIEAACYSLMAGGKRIRPILCLLGYELFTPDPSKIVLFSCGLECLHTYSLIHDDLPAMDNDDFRRGRPSCHKAFDEATAILAGDGLQALAFYFFTHRELRKKVKPSRLLKAINLVAEAVGFTGMVGGQMGDLLMEGKKGNKRILAWIHEKKTAKLFSASLVSGALLGGAKKNDLQILNQVGKKLGLAFQIVDDLLDLIGDEKILGKPIKSDLKKKKLTFPALYGIETSKKIAEEQIKSAISYLTPYGEKAKPLILLAEFISHRLN